MKADLRDLFAVHFAAALASEQRHTLEFIAERSYDLAEAMLDERERRIDADLRAVNEAADFESPRAETVLLDEPMPLSDDEEQPLLDPSWFGSSPESVRPGLARTRPEDAEERKKQRTA